MKCRLRAKEFHHSRFESLPENFPVAVAAAILAASDAAFRPRGAREHRFGATAASRRVRPEPAAACRLHWQAGSPPPHFQTDSELRFHFVTGL